MCCVEWYCVFGFAVHARCTTTSTTRVVSLVMLWYEYTFTNITSSAATFGGRDAHARGMTSVWVRVPWPFLLHAYLAFGHSVRVGVPFFN